MLHADLIARPSYFTMIFASTFLAIFSGKKFLMPVITLAHKYSNQPGKDNPRMGPKRLLF